jgi:hypothetical protein
VSLGDVLGLASLVLVVAGLALTWIVYALARFDSERQDVEGARGLLRAALAGMPGDLYFEHGYTVLSAQERADQDRRYVLEGTYGEIFPVSTASLTTLLSSVPLAPGRWIRESTIEAVGVAVWKIGTFNELVRQKSDFNGRHLVEIFDTSLDERRRKALADAAASQSAMLHGGGLGDAAWWGNLKRELAANISYLDGLHDAFRADGARLRAVLPWER